jgi:hypothetical protein
VDAGSSAHDEVLCSPSIPLHARQKAAVRRIVCMDAAMSGKSNSSRISRSASPAARAAPRSTYPKRSRAAPASVYRAAGAPRHESMAAGPLLHARRSHKRSERRGHVVADMMEQEQALPRLRLLRLIRQGAPRSSARIRRALRRASSSSSRSNNGPNSCRSNPLILYAMQNSFRPHVAQRASQRFSMLAFKEGLLSTLCGHLAEIVGRPDESSEHFGGSYGPALVGVGDDWAREPEKVTCRPSSGLSEPHDHRLQFRPTDALGHRPIDLCLVL